MTTRPSHILLRRSTRMVRSSFAPPRPSPLAPLPSFFHLPSLSNIKYLAYMNFINTYSKIYKNHPKFFLICGPMQNSVSCPYPLSSPFLLLSFFLFYSSFYLYKWKLTSGRYVEYVAAMTNATYVNLVGILQFPADYGCGKKRGDERRGRELRSR